MVLKDKQKKRRKTLRYRQSEIKIEVENSLNYIQNYYIMYFFIFQ